MSNTTVKTNPSRHYPAASPRAWGDCPEGCQYNLDETGIRYNTPHVIVWPEDGRLTVSPECSQGRFLLPVAGVLAFAGIPVTRIGDEHNWSITTDNGYQDRIIQALNDAGADVTISAGDNDA